MTGMTGLTTEYLLELRESARTVMSGAGMPAAEETTWPLIVELGWLLAAVPDELDGLGLGVAGACTLQSELGRALSQAPFLPAAMLLDAVCHSEQGAAERADWVARLAGGEVCTAALAEPAIQLQKGSDGVERLDGIAFAVQSADKAEKVLVWTAGGDCVAVIALEQAGVKRVARPTWDVTRRLFDLTLERVNLAEQTVLARGAAARALIQRLQTLRDLSLAADSIGGAAALLELTLEHLRTRKQFGRPLAMFQALKHRCADMKALLAGAESLLQDTLARVAESLHESDAIDAARRAKQLACAAFATVAEESLQLHGGIGMADEHPCHLFLKRAMLNEHLGTAERGYEIAIADSFLRSA
jgi:alkylation response protein AidB-like acyl-CoA dehydrogenase